MKKLEINLDDELFNSLYEVLNPQQIGPSLNTIHTTIKEKMDFVINCLLIDIKNKAIDNLLNKKANEAKEIEKERLKTKL